MLARVACAARGEQEVHFAGEPTRRGDWILGKLAKASDAVRHRKVRRGPLGKRRKPKQGILGDAEDEARNANWWSGEGKDKVNIEEAFERSDSEVTVAEESESSEDLAVARHEPVGFEDPQSARLSICSHATSNATAAAAAAKLLADDDDPWADSDKDPWADSDDEPSKSGAGPLGGDAQPAPVVAVQPPKPRSKSGSSGPPSAQEHPPQRPKKASATARTPPSAQQGRPVTQQARPTATGTHRSTDKSAKQKKAASDPWASSDEDQEDQLRSNRTPPKANNLAPKPSGRSPAVSAGSSASLARSKKEAKTGGGSGRPGEDRSVERRVRLPKEDPKAQASKKKTKEAAAAPKKIAVNEKVEHFAAF